jgi:hypothetical protein
MNALKTVISPVIVLAGAVLACGSAQAAPGCDSVSPFQRQVVEHADGDVGVLRAFVVRNTLTHGGDMWEVQSKLDQWRSAVECRKFAAAAAAAKEADVAKAGGTTAPSDVAQR